MCIKRLRQFFFLFCISTFLLTGCTGQIDSSGTNTVYTEHHDEATFASRLPDKISMGKEKVILVDPRNYAWGAYNADGTLVRAGIATSGGDVCDDEDKSCRTATGTYRIQSLGDDGCYSKVYPRPKGGGLMPYCMFFHNGMALHGSPDSIVVEQNVSHGCVRMRIPDAEWMRYNFASVGTKVVVLPY